MIFLVVNGIKSDASKDFVLLHRSLVLWVGHVKNITVAGVFLPKWSEIGFWLVCIPSSTLTFGPGKSQ